MLLKNIDKRLITINATKMKDGKRGKAYQIKPGNNPAVSVPDDVCKGNKFIDILIKSGSLQVIAEVEQTTNEYDDMSKDDVKAVAESLDIEVKSSWSKTKIIEEITLLDG